MGYCSEEMETTLVYDKVGKFWRAYTNVPAHLTKFNKHWYKKQTKTFIADPSSPKVFTLKDIFSDCDDIKVKSKAKVR